MPILKIGILNILDKYTYFIAFITQYSVNGKYLNSWHFKILKVTHVLEICAIIIHRKGLWDKDAGVLNSTGPHEI
jgi:hypothetical protein